MSKTYYKKIKEFEKTPFWYAVLALIKLLLKEARERQDIAEEKELYRNQGAIKELKGILKNMKISEDAYEYTEAYGS